jgi:hypothetical protein
MKKFCFFAALAVPALMLAGCGSAEQTIDTGALVRTLVTELTYEDTLEPIDDDDLSVYIDLPQDVTGIMYMGSGSTAEEVAAFTAPDEDTAKETIDRVQSYLDDQSDAFSDELPEEAKRVGNAVLEQKGNYVVLCVSGDSETAREMIEEAFK